MTAAIVPPEEAAWTRPQAPRILTRTTPGSTERRRVSHTPNTITAPPATWAIPTGSARTIAPSTTAPKGTRN